MNQEETNNRSQNEILRAKVPSLESTEAERLAELYILRANSKAKDWFQSENSRLKALVKALESDREKQGSLDEITKENQELRTQNQSLRAARDAIDQRHFIEVEKLKEMLAEIERGFLKRIDSIEGEHAQVVNNLTTQNEGRQAQVQTLQKQTEDLNMDLNGLKSLNATLHSQIQTLESTKNTQVRGKTALIEDLKSQIAGFQSRSLDEKQQCQDEIKELKSRNENLVEQIHTLVAEEQMRSRNHVMEMNVLKTSKAALHARFQCLEAEAEAHIRNTSTNVAVMDEQKKKVAGLELEVQRGKFEVEEHNAIVSQLRTQNSSLQEDIHRLETAGKKHLRDHIADRNGLKAINAGLASQVKHLESELEACNREHLTAMEEHKSKIASLESEALRVQALKQTRMVENEMLMGELRAKNESLLAEIKTLPDRFSAPESSQAQVTSSVSQSRDTEKGANPASF